ncbi:MAG: Alkanal monooxygenase [Naasia sp.]|jgi:luciferase family oxidoreductase group 1|uniref:LLM class flavin-dependent oxidoreductase n=1 Tax=Naasia sp. TaxID=2546198 RepID=UPI00261986FA|nr:LLM class flavin-dependent oxidoreductase [Naasia sp.]MCU1569378.1 Alkanal monooxygenase [Naasia sp.]
MSVPLSVLDLASVAEGMTHSEALADTLSLARTADELGYRRFWVAEHHGMPGVASSSPPVLIGAIAAATKRIRVGSGGVMLPNHSSLIVAEQFGTLVALHGDRIDLGLGRAPGTDPVTTAAVRRGATRETVEDFPDQVLELLAYFGTIPPLAGGQGSRILAIPGLGDAPQLWLLGSSDFSARLAGMMGLPFAFAHHFAGGRNTPIAFEVYRGSFTPSAVMQEPHAAVAVAAIVAESDAEARRLMLPNALAMARLRSGRPGRTPTLEQAEAHDWSGPELAYLDDRIGTQGIGSLETVTGRIASLVEETGANEVIVVPQGPDLGTRQRTLTALAPRA